MSDTNKCPMCNNEVQRQSKSPRLNGYVLACSKCSYMAEETDHNELYESILLYKLNIKKLQEENNALKQSLRLVSIGVSIKNS